MNRCGDSVFVRWLSKRDARPRTQHATFQSETSQACGGATFNRSAKRNQNTTATLVQLNWRPSWNITFLPGPPSAAPNCSRTFAPSLISRDLLLPSPRLSPPLVFLRGGSHPSVLPPLRSHCRSLHLSLACSPLSIHLFCTISLTPSLTPTCCQSPLGKSPV